MGAAVHKNNFEFLRLIFALFVLVTHSYELAGQSYFDFLYARTDFQIGFSYMGVRGFFIISGYLIFQSLMRSKDLVDYFWKRVLRIFPALFVVLALTVLLGPLVYEAQDSYWRNPQVWTYFPRNAALYPLQPTIKGIFDSNVYPRIINGSLWTICYEFTCYVALAALFFVRRAGTRVLAPLLLVIFAVVFVGNLFFFDVLKQHAFYINFGDFFELGAFFWGGAVLAALNYERFKYIDIATVVATVLIVVSILTGHFLDGPQFLFSPFVVIGLGIRSTRYLRDIGDYIGDISYGIYIYGFLVQQTLMHFFVFDYITLFFATVPITLVLGYASWHLVEKRALRLKNWRPTGWIERKMGLQKS
jgi:peptidoglycan/LPS O-acetylase OafA/YrhL